MTGTRLGSIVHEGRGGHLVVEWLDEGEGGNSVAGFVLVGPLASASIIYANRVQALHALQDIEDRASDG